MKAKPDWELPTFCHSTESFICSGKCCLKRAFSSEIKMGGNCWAPLLSHCLHAPAVNRVCFLLFAALQVYPTLMISCAWLLINIFLAYFPLSPEPCLSKFILWVYIHIYITGYVILCLPPDTLWSPNRVFVNNLSQDSVQFNTELT